MIVDAAIGQAMQTVESVSAKLSYDLSSRSDQAPAQEKAAAYDAVLIAIQDVVDATRRAMDELEKERVDEGDVRMQDLHVTNLAVNYNLLSWRIGRYRTLIGADDGLDFSSMPQRNPRKARKINHERSKRAEARGRKMARLRERVALYDAILQSVDSIKELRGAARDGAWLQELNGQRAYFQALKCLNISHSHAMQSAHKEALALCDRALMLASQAVSAPRPPDLTPIGATKLVVSAEQAALVEEKLKGTVLHYRGMAAFAALSPLSAPSQQTAPAKDVAAAPIIARLNEFPASGRVDLGNLVTWPPRLKPVPVKPVFLDVAWNYAEYPTAATEDKQKQEEVSQPAKKKTGWSFFGRG